MNDNKGLYQKYVVTRTDGKDITGQDFFCLRLDAPGYHGQACRHAARDYARFIRKKNPQLADDIEHRCNEWAARLDAAGTRLED